VLLFKGKALKPMPSPTTSRTKNVQAKNNKLQCVMPRFRDLVHKRPFDVHFF
jgi:hypothetical protein